MPVRLSFTATVLPATSLSKPPSWSNMFPRTPVTAGPYSGHVPTDTRAGVSARAQEIAGGASHIPAVAPSAPMNFLREHVVIIMAKSSWGPQLFQLLPAIGTTFRGDRARGLHSCPARTRRYFTPVCQKTILKSFKLLRIRGVPEE